MKTETCRLYSRVFRIFLPNIIKIDPCNFELYRFKVEPFLRHSVQITSNTFLRQKCFVFVTLSVSACLSYHVPRIPFVYSVLERRWKFIFYVDFYYLYYTVFRKKHPLTFPFISSWIIVDLNKNCSEYTQGLVDSENIKIRYSLRWMT